MSWLHEPNGYQVLFNRDEKLTRARADGPRIAERNGVRFLAPVDGDHGGTWIAANQFGVTICLLNGANITGTAADHPVRAPRSRGLLLLELGAEKSAGAVSSRLSRMDLAAYSPFTLLAIEPNQPVLAEEWSGADYMTVANANELMPLISSSFDPAGVRQSRRQEFQRCHDLAGRVDAEMLYSFHESHGREPSAYSPCMHRADARTVSFSWVKVSAREVDFFYSPDAPCQWKLGERTSLPRSEARAEARP
ncbi:MAG: NRDE family protein [Bryobacteraceae bacterium]